MRTKLIASAAALFIGGAGGLTLAVPAFAVTASDTPVTVEVTGGDLNITAPTQSVNLGSVVTSNSPQTVRALLGNVMVTDNGGAQPGGPPPPARRTSPGLRPSQPVRSAWWSIPRHRPP
jgi:hypothetical protein